MTTIPPAQAQRRTDRPLVLDTLADLHTKWGYLAWRAGDYRTACVHWKAAARFGLAADREGGEQK